MLVRVREGEREERLRALHVQLGLRSPRPAFSRPASARQYARNSHISHFSPKHGFAAVLFCCQTVLPCSVGTSERKKEAHGRELPNLSRFSSTRPLLLQPHALLRPPLLTPLGPLLPPPNVLPPTAKRTGRIRSLSRISPELIRQPVVGRPNLTGSLDRLSPLGQDRALFRGGSGRAGGRSWGFPRLERVLNLLVVSGLTGERTGEES